jgi:hypothetical protein
MEAAVAPLFFAALPLSIVKGTTVSGSWLTILWTAFGVSLTIGLLSLDIVWNRISSVGARVPYEIRRKRTSGHGDVAGFEVPLDPRQQRRFALADEATRLAADLTGHCEYWKARYSREIRPAGAPIDDTDAAIGNMMRNYHSKYRVRTVEVFDRLVAEGVAEAEHRSSIKRPAHTGIVESIADLLDEAAERLRVSDKVLSDWLGEQIREVEALRADLQEQADRSVPDHRRMDIIRDGFWRVNGEVLHRLRKDGKGWLGYYSQTPPWFEPAVMRITSEQLQEELRFFDYTTEQLVRIREQVS